MPAAKTVLMIGCFDTKGEDFDFLHSCLVEQNVKVIESVDSQGRKLPELLKELEQ